MFTLKGKNFLNILFFNLMPENSLFFEENYDEIQNPSLWWALNHLSLQTLKEINLNFEFTPFYEMHVVNKGASFFLTAEQLQLKYLGGIVYAPSLYNKLKENTLFQYAKPKKYSIISSSKYLPDKGIRIRHSGYSISFEVEVECSFFRAIQVFDLPAIIGILPIDQSRVSIILSTQDKNFLASKSTDEFHQFLRDTIKPSELVIKAIIKQSEIYTIHTYHAPAYLKQSHVLLGSSAHSMHPLCGQGVNLGIADAYVLAKALQDPCLKTVHEKIQFYQNKQYAKNHLWINFCHELAHSNWSSFLLGPALTAFHRSYTIKRLLFSLFQGIEWCEISEQSKV